MLLHATSTKLKLLIVDDEPALVSAVSRTLRGEYLLVSAHSGDGALRLLEQNRDVAVILTDQRMGGISGTDLLARSHELAPRAARIVLTGYTDYQEALEAINRGHVHRFILKPFDPELLRSAVRDAAGSFRLQLERDELLLTLEDRNRKLEAHERELERLVAERTREYKEANTALELANARLSELALRDGLTGLYNHRYFQERLTAEVARARRHEHPLGLVLLDIDHFKGVNDVHGHPGGDQVLKALAQILTGGIKTRASDVAARYGGEEFALLLPETPLEGVAVKAELLRRMVAEHRFAVGGDGTLLKLSISLGTATFPFDGQAPAELVERADRALYGAKQGGRNRVVSAGGFLAGLAAQGPRSTETPASVTTTSIEGTNDGS